MKARYTAPITRREAEQFIRANVGNVRLPAGARYVWLAGVQTVTDQPGVYLCAASGGLNGVQVISEGSKVA